MKITRLSPFSHPPIKHTHLLALPKLRTLCADSHKAIDQAKDAATALVPSATQFLESQHQLVIVASKFTFDFSAPADGVMRIPISPAAACHEVRIEGIAAEGSRIINGFLVLPPATSADSAVSADIFVGWTPPQVPHLIQYALALIIAHWLINPANKGKVIEGNSLHHLGQCVGFHTHPIPIMRRVAPPRMAVGSSFTLPPAGGKA